MVPSKLNLPLFEFRFKENNNRKLIFDEIRKKYITLTPEEWVRQNFVRYLIDYKNYPSGLLSLEMSLSLNRTDKRCDIVVFDRQGNPILLIECKAPDVEIVQKTFDQAFVYNLKLKVKHFIITNGIKHFCFSIDASEKKINFLKDILEYSEIKET
jgi:hypothetical protein